MGETIYSKHHAAVSVVVAAVSLSALPSAAVFGQTVPPVGLLVYATAAGVLIDLDHFVIARLKTGGWDAVRFCLENPTAAVADQGRIFDRGDVGVLTRLLSHLLIAGALVTALAVVSVPLAVLTAVVLYAHLVSDVAWDVVRLRRRAGPTVSRPVD